MNRLQSSQTVSRVLLHLLLVAASVLFLFPFYWLLTAAFKTQPEIFQIPPQWIPYHPTVKNFAQLSHQADLLRAFLNSLINCCGQVALSLFLCSLAGYAFAKFPRAPGRDRLFAFVLGTMMIPGAVLLIPTFLVLVWLHWINTYLAMIVPGCVGAFGIYWMRQYMSAHLPDELIHAARIDGCSEFGIYLRVALPIARPALAALGIMQAIGSWNNLMWAFIVLRTPDMLTLPVIIFLLNGELRTPYGMMMAAGLLTTLPMVAAFLLFQRQFITGITAGAVKQ